MGRSRLLNSTLGSLRTIIVSPRLTLWKFSSRDNSVLMLKVEKFLVIKPNERSCENTAS